MICRHKFRRPFFQFPRHFHQYAPCRKTSLHSDGNDCPDLRSHKDWLSQPQVIRIFQTLKNPNFTLPLFDQLSSRKDYRPNESLYTTLIDKLAGAKNFDGIEALMRRIKVDRKCRLSDGFFRHVIKIYGHSAGRINRAVETLFDMPNYKCWPSVATFNCVLNLLVSTKQFEVVHEVYMGASRLAVEIDACSLNIIIKGLCECGQIEAAYKVFDEFPQQKCTPNVRTFSTIMHALCEKGRIEESFRLLEKMEMEGVEVDAIVFNILISGLRKQGRVEEGVELLDRMMEKGCNPNPGSYQEVLYCLLDTKRYCEARSLMEKMINKSINPSFESYKLVIRGLCREHRVEDVEWALKQMIGHGFVPRMGMWNQIIHCMLSCQHTILSASVFDHQNYGNSNSNI